MRYLVDLDLQLLAAYLFTAVQKEIAIELILKE